MCVLIVKNIYNDSDTPGYE